MSVSKQLIEQLQKLKEALGTKTEGAVLDRAMDLLKVVAEFEAPPQKSGIGPAATHPLQARMKDMEFHPPRLDPDLLTVDDLQWALHKRCKALPDIPQHEPYLTHLENDNWRLLTDARRLEKMERATKQWLLLPIPTDRRVEALLCEAQRTTAELIWKGQGPDDPASLKQRERLLNQFLELVWSGLTKRSLERG